MRTLEGNGYKNITGLKRQFAIEVDDYSEKETLLKSIFDIARIGQTEFFALNIDLVKQLLSSFEGTIIYPAEETKEEVFNEATEIIEDQKYAKLVPDGNYYLERKLKKDGNVAVKARMDVVDGVFYIRSGEQVSTIEGVGLSPGIRGLRDDYVNEGVVSSDVPFSSPSGAASFVIGASCNGWKNWKTKDNRPLDSFRRSS